MTSFYFDRAEVRFKFEEGSNHKGEWTVTGIRPDGITEDLTTRPGRNTYEYSKYLTLEYLGPGEPKRARSALWFNREGNLRKTYLYSDWYPLLPEDVPVPIELEDTTGFYFDSVELLWKAEEGKNFKGAWHLIGRRPNGKIETLATGHNRDYTYYYLGPQYIGYHEIYSREPKPQGATEFWNTKKRARIFIWYTKAGKFKGVKPNKKDPE